MQADWLPELPANLFPLPYVNQHDKAVESGKRKSTCAMITFIFIVSIYAIFLATATSEVIVVTPATYTSGSSAIFPYAQYSAINEKTGLKCPCSSASIVMKDLLTKDAIPANQANGIAGLKVDLPRDQMCPSNEATLAQCQPAKSNCNSVATTISGALNGICAYSRSISLKLVKMFQQERLFLPNLLNEQDFDRFMYARGSTLKAQAGMQLQVPLDAIKGVYAMDRPQMNWFVKPGGYGTDGVPTGDALNYMIKLPNQGSDANKVMFAAAATTPYGEVISTGANAKGECNCAQDWNCWRQDQIPIPSQVRTAFPNDPLFSKAFGTANADEKGNPTGFDATDGKFKFNFYCSLFDTMSNIPVELYTSPVFWKVMKTQSTDPPPVSTEYKNIAEAIEYGFLKMVSGEPSAWGKDLSDADREKFSGLLYSHAKLYSQCHPTHCTYAEQRTRGGGEVFMLLVGLAGSLWLYAKALGPIIYDNALEDSSTSHIKRNDVLEKVLGEPEPEDEVVEVEYAEAEDVEMDAEDAQV